MSFYDSYPHIGYDINGKKIMRPATGDALDALLDSIEVPKGWTGLTDIHTGNPLNLKYAPNPSSSMLFGFFGIRLLTVIL